MSETEAGEEDRVFGELSQNSDLERRRNLYQSDQNMAVIKNSAQAKEIRALKVQNADLTTENKELRAKYAAVLKQLNELGKQPKSKAQKVNDAIADRVKKIVRKPVWRIYKFITCEKELKKVGTMIALECDGVKDDLAGLDRESPEFQGIITTFVDTYGGIITSTLNEYRSTCQSQIKKVFTARLESGLLLPTPDQLREILKRKDLFEDDEGDDGLTSEAKKSGFLWYWDELLPKTAGNGMWGLSQRYYGTISKHTPAGQPKKVCITSPTKTMTLLFYYNGYSKWLYEEKCAKKKVDPDKNHPHFYTKYSDSKAGQNRWGGWGNAGRKMFKELLQEISATRRSSEARKAEAWALKALRLANSIEQLEERRANSRCRKRKTDTAVSEDEEEGYVSYTESLGDDGPAKKGRAGAEESDSENEH